MARSEARIFTARNADKDWRALPVDAQWLYDLLLSQVDLSHAGMLRLSVGRWSRLAAGAGLDRVQAALDVLVDRRYVVVDEETEELLIRTLLRRDNVWKSWPTLLAAKKSAATIESPALRIALAREVARIDPSELGTGENALSVASLLSEIIDVLVGPDGGGPQSVDEAPSEAPSEGGTLRPPPRPPTRGKGEGEGAGAVVQAPVVRGSSPVITSQRNHKRAAAVDKGDLDRLISDALTDAGDRVVSLAHAAKVRQQVLGDRAVRDPVAYVLAAVRSDPARYLPTPMPPRFSVVRGEIA